MQCPACQNRQLVESMTRQGVLVDICPDCDGVWLDRGEVFEFSDKPGTLHRAIDNAQLSGESHERACPRCRDALVGITFLEDDLWVDYCRDCKGFWFDDGELSRAVDADPSTFDLELDESATLEVDWEATEGTNSGGTNDWAETADGGTSRQHDESAAASTTGRGTDNSLEPTSAVNSPAAAAHAASGGRALPSLALRSAGVFFVLYGLLTVVLIALTELGYLSPGLALLGGLVAAAAQFIISPWVMDLSLNWVYSMHWADRSELPAHLDDFIDQVCRHEEMNYPDIGIIHDGAPNAFTYGHTPDNARVVITRGLLDLLEPEEVEAVVAHEIGHARNWDMLIMTVANLVPLVLYVLFRLLVGRGRSGGNRKGGKGALVGVLAFVLYIVSEYIVLFLSRTREYHADRYAGRVTGSPNALASALVRIGYGLAAGGGRSRGDEDDDLMSDSAFGAFGVFDAEAADAMAISSYDNDDVERSANSGGEGIDATDIDRKRLVDAMKWDLWNPWAKFYELNSTHPLVAERIQHLSDQATSVGQRPFLEFDVEKPESYWDEFSIDVLVHLGPMLMVGLGLAVGLYGVAAHGSTIPFGALLMFAGLSYLGKTIFSYPAQQFPDHSVASCLSHVKVSGTRGVPVSIDGTLIGRGVPGLIYSEDFVLQDETGIIFVDYRQPLRIWEFFFGLLRNADYQNQPVRIEGWYRRSPVPYIEIKKLHATGSTETSYVYHVKLAVGVLAAISGAGLMFLGSVSLPSLPFSFL